VSARNQITPRRWTAVLYGIWVIAVFGLYVASFGPVIETVLAGWLGWR
jgi:hypothetical protein